MPHRVNSQLSPRTLRRLRAPCVKSFLLLFVLSGCGHSKATGPDSLTLLIESSPTNLDPRLATDFQLHVGKMCDLGRQGALLTA
jgi:hypothetical protein